MHELTLQNTTEVSECTYIEIKFQTKTIVICFKDSDMRPIWDEVSLNKKSIQYLYSCLGTFLKQENVEPTEHPIIPLTKDGLLEKPITYVNDLSVRALNILAQTSQAKEYGGINKWKIKDLSKLSKSELKIKSGKKTFHEIERFAHSFGIKLQP